MRLLEAMSVFHAIPGIVLSSEQLAQRVRGQRDPHDWLALDGIDHLLHQVLVSELGEQGAQLGEGAGDNDAGGLEEEVFEAGAAVAWGG
jgi:hypothetical protein